MKISEFLHPSDVLGELAGSTAQDVLAELCSPVAATSAVDPKTLLDSLLAREKLGSTGIGDGVAIPHSKVPGLPVLRASIGRSKAGVDFGAIDSKPAHLFVALFAPATGTGLHLHALSRISRILKNPSFRESLMAAPNAAEIYQLIMAEDAKP
jgi:PTS system nitrogen regulatory IIA component